MIAACAICHAAPRLSNLIIWEGWRTFPSAHRVTKVATRELAPRASLQVALELQRWLLLVDLDDDERAPWAVA